MKAKIFLMLFLFFFTFSYAQLTSRKIDKINLLFNKWDVPNHPGGIIGGFRPYVSVFPKDKLSIVLLTNFSLSNVGQKSKKVAQILLGGNI